MNILSYLIESCLVFSCMRFTVFNNRLKAYNTGIKVYVFMQFFIVAKSRNYPDKIRTAICYF